MSNFRLKAMPAALVAAGVMAVSGTALATGLGGIPSSIAGIYAQGTIAPTAYMAINRNMYSPLGTDAPTATGGFIMVLLKPAQTAWGYALTKSAGSSGTDTAGTATLTHSLTTGTTTCTATYDTVYDSQGTITLSMASVAASPATATSTCKTAFSNQTGLPAAFYTPTGSSDAKTFNLIY